MSARRGLSLALLLLSAATLAAAQGAAPTPPPAEPGETAAPAPPAAAAPDPLPAPPGSAPPGPASIGSGQINGTVLDLRRHEVVGLPVVAVARGGGFLHGTNTDATGRYAFRGLESGLYDIVIEPAAGRRLRKDGIRVRPLFRSIVDFTLPDEPSVVLMPAVTVSGAESGAGRLRIEGAIATVDRLAAPDASVTITPVVAAGGAAAGSAQSARSGMEGAALLSDVVPGSYRLSVRSPGLIPWSFGPIELTGSGRLRLVVHLVPFPMGFEGTLEDALVPADPVQP